MNGYKPFDGKAVLVTGGARGIGAAIARRFAEQGAMVGVGYRSGSAVAEKLASELGRLGAKAVAIAGDIAVSAEAETMVRAARDAFGRFDVLVNAAGIGTYKPLAEVDEAHYRAVFDTNVLGTIMLTKAAAEVLPSPGGRIIHLSSRLAYNPMPSSSVYSASKAAVVALTHGFARELGPRGITVNAIAPGVIETDMTTDIIAQRGDMIRSLTPLGRIGQPDDIAGIATFLASDDARWITGRTIIADGGLN